MGDDVCRAIRSRNGTPHAEIPPRAVFAAIEGLFGSKEHAMESARSGYFEYADE